MIFPIVLLISLDLALSLSLVIVEGGIIAKEGGPHFKKIS